MTGCGPRLIVRRLPDGPAGCTKRSMNRGWVAAGSQFQKMIRSARSRSSSKAAVTSPTRAKVGPVGTAVSGAPASMAAASRSAIWQAGCRASRGAAVRPVTSTRRAVRRRRTARSRASEGVAGTPSIAGLLFAAVNHRAAAGHAQLVVVRLPGSRSSQRSPQPAQTRGSVGGMLQTGWGDGRGKAGS